MFCRLLLVLSVALAAGHVCSAQSGPLRELRANLPQDFLRALDRHDGSEFYSPTELDSIAAQAGLHSAALPPDAFEQAASRGLASLAQRERTPSLEEWIVMASAGAGLYSGSAGITEPSPTMDPAAQESPYGSGITVRELAYILINRAEYPAGSQDSGRAAPSGRGGGYSLFHAIMNTQLDAEFVETAAEVVTPTVTDDGIIALNFLGLREFAFLVSPDTNRVQVMDFSTGTTITLNQSAYYEPSPNSYGLQHTNQPPQARTVAARLTVQVLISRTKRFLSSYVLHPFTLGSLLLFAIFWLVLRIARRLA